MPPPGWEVESLKLPYSWSILIGNKKTNSYPFTQIDHQIINDMNQRNKQLFHFVYCPPNSFAKDVAINLAHVINSIKKGTQNIKGPVRS